MVLVALEAGRARLWTSSWVKSMSRTLSCFNSYCQGALEWGFLTGSCSSEAAQQLTEDCCYTGQLPGVNACESDAGYLLEHAPTSVFSVNLWRKCPPRSINTRCKLRRAGPAVSGHTPGRLHKGWASPSLPSPPASRSCRASPRPQPCRPAESARGLWPDARWFCRRAGRWQGCISPERRHSAGAAGCCTTLGGRRTPEGGEEREGHQNTWQSSTQRYTPSSVSASAQTTKLC